MIIKEFQKSTASTNIARTPAFKTTRHFRGFLIVCWNLYWDRKNEEPRAHTDKVTNCVSEAEVMKEVNAFVASPKPRQRYGRWVTVFTTDSFGGSVNEVVLKLAQIGNDWWDCTDSKVQPMDGAAIPKIVIPKLDVLLYGASVHVDTIKDGSDVYTRWKGFR